MATVTVEINGRPYAVGCADGQEDRVRSLAGGFDAHVRRVARDVGQVGEIRLFLMAALLLSDELHELKLATPAVAGGGDPETERRAVLALTTAAERIEALL